jgi:peptidoglycan/xylan/chitin deacetylase (PgdA/CDA1 family)
MWPALAVFLAGLCCFFAETYSVPVLMYHRVNQGAQTSRLIVTPESFERQMRFLSEHHYQVMPLDEYAGLLRKGKRPPRKSVVITFDDGYEDNYRNAYPVLKRFNFPSAMFVVVQWIGAKEMMSWEHLKELSRGGLVEIGSHSMTHCELPNVPKGQAVNEIIRSKQVLESTLGITIRYLCYPCGFFNAFIKEQARQAGYQGACATHPGKAVPLRDEFAIRRIRVSRSADNLFIFWVQVSGYYTFLKDHFGR